VWELAPFGAEATFKRLRRRCGPLGADATEGPRRRLAICSGPITFEPAAGGCGRFKQGSGLSPKIGSPTQGGEWLASLGRLPL